MKRFVLVREEGGVYELFSRAQLEREVSAMSKVPCAVGIVTAYKEWFAPDWQTYGPAKWHRTPKGVVYDFVLERHGYTPPLRSIGSFRGRHLTKRERAIANNVALRSIIRAARKAVAH